MPFLEKYDLMYGARYLLERSIFTPLLEERIYSHNASRRSGVVGNTGRNIPAKASPVQSDASVMYRYFFIFFLIFAKINLIS